MSGRQVWRATLAVVSVVLVGSLMLPSVSHARTAAEINAGVNAALVKFTKVKGSTELLRAAKGVLVFADVVKAGAGIGGEFGEGALRISGKTVAYYSFASASVGLQFGVQRKDVIILFMQDGALRDFRASEGWQVGVDGSIVLIEVGAGGSIDTTKANKPIIGFVVGQKGLMYNLTLEGSKITKLPPK